MRVYIFYVFIFLGLFSCEEDNKIEDEIAKINVNVDVERFDLVFSNTSEADFPKLKKASFPHHAIDELPVFISKAAEQEI